MMKINKKIILISSSLTVAFITMAFLLYQYVVLPPSSDKIFNAVSESVVEVKAESGDHLLSFGSAEIVTKEGRLLTNAHVVTYSKLSQIVEFESYWIRFSFEDEYREAELVKYNTEIDIAVLQIKEMPSFQLKVMNRANPDKLKAGDKVYAVGNSQNHGIGISQGIVSVPLLKIEYEERSIDAIKCDLVITEGNSGGALLNEAGKLIGITAFRLKDNSGNVVYGIAYGIPITVAYDYLKS